MSFQPSETLRSRTYLSLLVAQFLAGFNDQATHIVAIFYGIDMLVRYAHLGHGKFDEKAVISIATGCFIMPFFLFSTLAGMLADKYSKRSILVFWKWAEVGMMGLGLVGFLLPHAAALGWGEPHTLAIWSAVLVISTVFLMGTHSAFFVPAKYGVMPEILQHTILSRGNGFLEATSFVAQIIGTACGGFLYVLLKSKLDEGTGDLELGREWLIGLLLLGLAVFGALCSLLIEWMPAAAPQQPLTWKLWQPLGRNVGVLVRSRPLALSVLGIAYFSFITLFARQTLLYNGEASKDRIETAQRLTEAQQVASFAEVRPELGAFLAGAPKGPLQTLPAFALRDAASAPPGAAGADGGPGAPALPEVPGEHLAPTEMLPATTPTQQAEFQVALLIALVGLGIGIGSPLAGLCSGQKVELGLVPIGTFFLIVFTVLLALLGPISGGTPICLVLIGVAAGFYIVPLYTLLQHRAPKDSKGNLVATSNFINVVGGLLAVGVFWLMTLCLERLGGLTLAEPSLLPPDLIRHTLAEPTVGQHLNQLQEYLSQLQRYSDQASTKATAFPTILFLAASVMTSVMLFLLGHQLPDFFTRTLLWLRSLTRYHLHVIGLNNLPSDGPVILATNCRRPEGCMQVLTATDRFTRFILVETSPADQLGPVLRYLIKRTHLGILKPGKVTDPILEQTLTDAVGVLQRGDMVGLPADSNGVQLDVDKFLHDLRQQVPGTAVLPVYCGSEDPDPPGATKGEEKARRWPPVYVVIGRAVAPGTSAIDIRHKIHSLGTWIKHLTGGSRVDASTTQIPALDDLKPES